MWSPKFPLLFLPEDIRTEFLVYAEIFLNELRTQRLTVILIPAPYPQFSGHRIRVAQSHNPLWYRALYEQYSPNLRRDRSLHSLERICEGADKSCLQEKGPYSYDFIYRTFLKEALIEGFETEHCTVDPNELVKDFFELPFPSLNEPDFYEKRKTNTELPF
ncbi:MAG: hypothetical protein KC548_01690 [Nanoarchaeota archaeon]|nr:hypothetical protein [Nanoarchaeota archaeon]